MGLNKSNESRNFKKVNLDEKANAYQEVYQVNEKKTNYCKEYPQSPCSCADEPTAGVDVELRKNFGYY